MKIDPEFAALCPPLQDAEFSALRESILAEGCRDALATWRGSLIDGHHRERICRENKITYVTAELELPDRDAVKVWIIRNQFARRNLTPFQRAELALKLEPLIAAKAEARMKAGKADPRQNSAEGKALDTKSELAAIAGVSHDTITKAKSIAAEASEETKTKLRRGETTIHHEAKVLKRMKRERCAADAEKRAQKESAGTLLEGICRVTVSDYADCVKTCGADIIITDPPYPKEYLSLYDGLAQSARKAGIERVVVMCGESYLPEIFALMCKHLTYRWTACYLTPGGSVKQWDRKVMTQWKPLLIFGSGGEILDVFRSDARDKRYHHWGQSISGMADIVGRLSAPGETVCDPFCGGGATAVAAMLTHRKFVGCDIEASCVETTLERARKAHHDATKK